MIEIRKALVVGTPDRLQEFQEISRSQSIHWTLVDSFYLASFMGEMEEVPQELDENSGFFPQEMLDLDEYDLIFDLNLDEIPIQLEWYAERKDQVIIGAAAQMTLGEIQEESLARPQGVLIGWNCLPSFMGRPLKEWSLNHPKDLETAKAVAKALEWDVEFVDDRAGMVSPRIICMIINEACFTLQEGTASAVDIDNAMKLGTAYPFGPFEWAERIGLPIVFQVLLALQREMGEEKYKICPLLRNKVFKGQRFLS